MNIHEGKGYSNEIHESHLHNHNTTITITMTTSIAPRG